MAKPPKTKIKLRKIGDQLNIVVPRKQKFSMEAIHQVAITVAIDLAAVFLLGYATWVITSINLKINVGPGHILGAIIASIGGIWLLGMAFSNSTEMCKQLFSDTSVSIDQKNMSLSTQFFLFDWGTLRRIKVKDITRIIVTEYKYIEGIDPTKSPCFLVLELDSGTVNLFATEHRLSRDEAKWLGKELSRWLNVRLVVD
jgi:hypothetical protein